MSRPERRTLLERRGVLARAERKPLLGRTRTALTRDDRAIIGRHPLLLVLEIRGCPGLPLLALLGRGLTGRWCLAWSSLRWGALRLAWPLGLLLRLLLRRLLTLLQALRLLYSLPWPALLHHHHLMLLLLHVRRHLSLHAGLLGIELALGPHHLLRATGLCMRRDALRCLLRRRGLLRLALGLLGRSLKRAEEGLAGLLFLLLRLLLLLLQLCLLLLGSLRSRCLRRHLLRGLLR